MKGLEICKAYFEEYGRALVNEFDPEGVKISAGLLGYGSECLGYDDELSTDHDFEPRFYLWMDEKTEEEIGFKLMRAYNKLPREFMGYKVKERSVYGGDRGGVSIVKDFFKNFTGLNRPPESAIEWLNIPDYALLSATSGEVFREGSAEFRNYLEVLKNARPKDVALKKISARLALMAQSGQYNYHRALKRGEKGTAAMAATEYATKGLELLFLLNNRYAPYYKWLCRAARELPVLGDLAFDLEEVLTAPTNNAKGELIENIAARISSHLRDVGLSPISDDYLETHAVHVFRQIRDKDLISLHLLEG